MDSNIPYPVIRTTGPNGEIVIRIDWAAYRAAQGEYESDKRL